jgi:hypothetical protein
LCNYTTEVTSLLPNLKLDGLTLGVEDLRKSAKVKAKRVYNVPEDSKRCIEKKKDGGRCLGRLTKNSSNNNKCQLHINKANGIDPRAAKKAKAMKATTA